MIVAVDNSQVPLIALVTCVNLPEPDPDAELLLAACHAAGIEVEFAAWDDPEVDWSRFESAVLHSCWNYYRTPDLFREWVRRTSKVTRIFNPSELIEWNIDKRYLIELEGKGVSIVPTRILERPSEIESAISETGWERFVLKPTVSASSYMTRAFGRKEREQSRVFAQGFDGKPFIAQRFMSKVEAGGEAALVHIDGLLTHGVVKRPRFEGHEESVSEAFDPTKDQVLAAAQVMAQIDLPWLYARVDLMLDDSGGWLLSELELIEPSLFFLQHPPALDRFVAALSRCLV